MNTETRHFGKRNSEKIGLSEQIYRAEINVPICIMATDTANVNYIMRQAMNYQKKFNLKLVTRSVRVFSVRDDDTQIYKAVMITVLQKK